MKLRELSYALILSQVHASSVARGSIKLLNNCDFSLFIQGFQRSSLPYVDTMINPHSTYSLPLRQTSSDGTGNSIKVSTAKGSANITQVEYSADFSQEIFWYDLSDINGNPLIAYGTRLRPSLNCPVVTCEPFNWTCQPVYHHPEDNWATKACSTRSDLNVELCTG